MSPAKNIQLEAALSYLNFIDIGFDEPIVVRGNVATPELVNPVHESVCADALFILTNRSSPSQGVPVVDTAHVAASAVISYSSQPPDPPTGITAVEPLASEAMRGCDGIPGPEMYGVVAVPVVFALGNAPLGVTEPVSFHVEAVVAETMSNSPPDVRP